jgi:hypothetical protein
MATRNDIERIQNMSFNQLKKELPYCKNNPSKELYIRNIMREKYIRYKKKKKLMVEKNRRQPLFIDSKSTTINESTTFNEINNLGNEPIRSILNDVVDPFPEDNKNNRNDFNLNESMEPRDPKKHKYKEEVDKDFLNNNLMDRLNSDIDIRKIKTRNKRDFVPPFSNDIGGDFAPFVYDKKIPQSDFSNKRILNDNF